MVRNTVFAVAVGWSEFPDSTGHWASGVDLNWLHYAAHNFAVRATAAWYGKRSVFRIRNNRCATSNCGPLHD